MGTEILLFVGKLIPAQVTAGQPESQELRAQSSLAGGKPFFFLPLKVFVFSLENLHKSTIDLVNN